MDSPKCVMLDTLTLFPQGALLLHRKSFDVSYDSLLQTILKLVWAARRPPHSYSPTPVFKALVKLLKEWSQGHELTRDCNKETPQLFVLEPTFSKFSILFCCVLSNVEYAQAGENLPYGGPGVIISHFGRAGIHDPRRVNRCD